MKHQFTKRKLLLMTLAMGISLYAGDHSSKTPSDLDLPLDVDTSTWTLPDKLLISARRKFAKEKAPVCAQFRARLAEIIAQADKVELLSIAAKSSNQKETEKFQILPYRSDVSVIFKANVSAQAMPKLLAQMQMLLRQADDKGGGAWCHEPVFAIRLYAKDRKLFETSICWKCHNYFVQYPDDGEFSASWVGFDGADDLRALCDSILKSVSPK